MLKEVLEACLGDYQYIGFTLREIDDRLELCFMGEHVAYFSPHNTVDTLRLSCQFYLNEYEFTKNN